MFEVQCLGCCVQDVGFKDLGLGRTVQGLGFKVWVLNIGT